MVVTSLVTEGLVANSVVPETDSFMSDGMREWLSRFFPKEELPRQLSLDYWASQGPILNVLDYGAHGDGVLDDVCENLTM